MSEAKDIFYDRAKELHLQYEETESLFKQALEGRVCLGIDMQEAEDTLKALENDKLEYSNDMLIEYVLGYVRRDTKDAKLLEILNNININNIDDDGIKGRAYPKYNDGSYYIEIGRDMSNRIQLLSDLFAIDFMCCNDLNPIEFFTLIKLNYASLLRFNNNETSNDSYNEAQCYMMICDEVFGNEFSDKYIALSREIQEMAMAFLVGHEIGHHYYGHTNQNNNAKENNHQIIKEIYADVFGMEFAFDYLCSAYPKCDNGYRTHQYAGIYIPLIVSAKSCDAAIQDTKSHPSVLRRMGGVNAVLREKLDKNEFQILQRLILSLCKKVELNELPFLI